uniref:Uncharacterized protein MANES_01G088000 n=1 Tax=Rhizophora mucronata TaxID=61149 RepID=A0A2P2LYR4_RHIMU
MEEYLKEAAKEGHVDELYKILARDPHVLERLDNIPFDETPVHIAARAGNTRFAVEVANLKPSLASKLNTDGLTAIHLAVERENIGTVRGLVAIDRDLVRIKGKEGMTSLHLVTKMGDVSFLEELLSCCPLSIEDLSARRETALHIAVKNRKLGALRVLFGFVHRVRKEEILNWKDEDGNTILHIAVSTNSLKAAELLVNEVNVDAKNLQNSTAMDIFENQGQAQNPDMGIILRRASMVSYFLNSLIQRRDRHLRVIGHARGLKNIAGDFRSVVLVVAVLIATATYQAVLSPPGGYWQDSCPHSSPPHVAGKMIMGSWESSYFGLHNTAGFCASVCTIIVLVMGLPFAFIMEACTMFMSCSYFVSVFTIFPTLHLSTMFLLVMFGAVLIFFHLVAFEIHRRKRERCHVGKGTWNLKT